jgi:trigger factor
MPTEALELKISVEKPAAWERRLKITVPAERVEQEKKQASARLAGRVRLPGFRKGHVPAGVMQRRFGPAIEQEAIEKLINDAYREALQSEGLRPITEGSVDNIAYQPGTDLTFDVALEVRPEVELERIGGFILLREEDAIDEQQVTDVLQRLRAEHAVWVPKQGSAPVSGDMATVEITPLDDSTSAQAQSPRQYQIVVGEGQALPAVEDAIRTLAAGEAAEFDIDLPESSPDTAGGTKRHRMRIHVLDVKAPQLPALDDDFARSLGEFADLATLQARIREDLEAEAAREAARRVRMQLVQHIVDANPFEVPQSMVRKYIEQLTPRREGANEEALEHTRLELWPAAEFALKRLLVIERVAELEGLQATAAEIDARVDAIAEKLGRTRGEVVSQLKKSGRLAELEHEITEDKVFQYLESLSDIR